MPPSSPSRRSLGPISSSPSGRQRGELPSQQPPDWKSMSLPCLAVRRSIASSAASVATIRSATALLLGSEEAERLGVIADQQALGLAVVLEHHLVVLAADAGGLVAAERRVGGVLV